MPKFSASEFHAIDVRTLLARHRKLKHLRVRKHADTLLIESEAHGETIKHTRLRRISVSYWRLEMPARSRWEVVPGKALLPQLVDDLLNLYPWTLAPVGSSR